MNNILLVISLCNHVYLQWYIYVYVLLLCNDIYVYTHDVYVKRDVRFDV